MMNFRYHLVSLAAVFTALAIGVVLGAGPLQARLSAALTTPSSATPIDNKEQLARLETALAAEASGLDAVAAEELPGTLDGLKVALVALPGAQADDVAKIGDALGVAGATVVGTAELTQNWESTTMTQYRHTLATPLASHMPGLPSDAADDAVIGFGVVTVLTSSDSETDLVKQILTDSATPILTFTEDPEGTAQAVVAVGPRAAQSGEAEYGQSDVEAVSIDTWKGLARAIGAAPKSGVLVADASDPNTILAQLRASKASVTSIDSPGTTLSALGTALALRTAGAEARSFGVGEGATQVLPALK